MNEMGDTSLPSTLQLGKRFMTERMEGHFDALMFALRAARENEDRWMQMSPESSADIERIDQWASVAKLRRLEVERIERLLAKMAGYQTLPQAESI